jgi:NADH-quinone oxidoreductase subunit A
MTNYIFFSLFLSSLLAIISYKVNMIFDYHSKYSGDGLNVGDTQKKSSYECGFEPFNDARVTFDVRFYLVGILFLIFDLEIAFLFPWSIILMKQSLFSFISVFFFLILLVIGFVYEWKSGGLEW